MFLQMFAVDRKFIVGFLQFHWRCGWFYWNIFIYKFHQQIHQTKFYLQLENFLMMTKFEIFSNVFYQLFQFFYSFFSVRIKVFFLNFYEI